jgi:hypothetical protein
VSSKRVGKEAKILDTKEILSSVKDEGIFWAAARRREKELVIRRAQRRRK